MSRLDQAADRTLNPRAWDIRTKFRMSVGALTVAVVLLLLCTTCAAPNQPWSRFITPINIFAFGAVATVADYYCAYLPKGTRPLRAHVKLKVRDFEWCAQCGFLTQIGTCLVIEHKGECLVLPAGSATLEPSHWDSEGPQLNIDHGLGSLSVKFEPVVRNVRGRKELESFMEDWVKLQPDSVGLVRLPDRLFEGPRLSWLHIDPVEFAGIMLFATLLLLLLVFLANQWLVIGSGITGVLLAVIGLLLLKSTKQDFEKIVTQVETEVR